MAGQQYGVSSTPTVFINGRAVMGAAPYALFDEIIREELEHAEQ
jgi:protein-disulfide isomerase